MRENKVQLDRRQKIVLVLTVLAFAFLAWQIYGLVRGDVVETAANDAARPPLVSNQAQSNPVTPKVAAAYHHNAPQEAELNSLNSTNNLSPEQQTYMQISSQYELAKLQRRLLDEQVAMADARNHITDTENRTNQIGSANAGANALSGAAALYTGSDPYRLSYLSQQGDSWNATIVANGEFKNIVVGDTLFDGSKVVAVDQQGVTLVKGNQTLRLTFGGVKNLTAGNNAKQAEVAPNAAPAVNRRS